ncbi:hypothetical protein V8E36_001037 [Tilletia maclaganii]
MASTSAQPSYSLAAWSLAPSAGASSSALTKRDPAIPSPPGFSAISTTPSKAKSAQATSSNSASRTLTKPTPAQHSALQQAKAWEVALAPAKNLPMNAIMLYMSGSGVQIFSMMAVGMLITNPLRALTSLDQPFQRLNSSQHSLAAQKLTFVVCQLACIALGLYKCWSMGLLPTESSDWLAWKQPKTPLEFSPLRT